MVFEPTTLRVLDLAIELLRTRWRARVILVGWTCEPHHAVTQYITSNTLRLNCIYAVTLIARNVSPMKEPPTNQPMPLILVL